MHIPSKNYPFDTSRSKRDRTRKTGDSAVSPVVGVMLMLIVVIIIAAVVSGFAGNLVGGANKKVPSLAMNLVIANSGNWEDSYFKGEVTSTSAPIPTRDLKIVTSWQKTLINGTVLNGGATTTPGIVNTNLVYDTHSGGYDLWRLTVPYGYGPGVGNGTTFGGNIFWTVDGGGGENALNSGAIGNSSWWGNYNLQPGTVFLARPFGGAVSNQAYGASCTGTTCTIAQMVSGYGVNTKFQYAYCSTAIVTPGFMDQESGAKLSMESATATGTGDKCKSEGYCGWQLPYPTSQPADQEPNVWIPYVSSLPANWDPRTYSIDQIQGVLGDNWEQLRAGDSVNVKIIYIPSGTTIWQKDVVVTGSMN